MHDTIRVRLRFRIRLRVSALNVGLPQNMLTNSINSRLPSPETSYSAMHASTWLWLGLYI